MDKNFSKKRHGKKGQSQKHYSVFSSVGSGASVGGSEASSAGGSAGSGSASVSSGASASSPSLGAVSEVSPSLKAESEVSSCSGAVSGAVFSCCKTRNLNFVN